MNLSGSQEAPGTQFVAAQLALRESADDVAMCCLIARTTEAPFALRYALGGVAMSAISIFCKHIRSGRKLPGPVPVRANRKGRGRSRVSQSPANISSATRAMSRAGRNGGLRPWQATRARQSPGGSSAPGATGAGCIAAGLVRFWAGGAQE